MTSLFKKALAVLLSAALLPAQMTVYDEAQSPYVQVGRERFYYLGDTGPYNIIASIHHFKVLEGLDD